MSDHDPYSDFDVLDEFTSRSNDTAIPTSEAQPFKTSLSRSDSATRHDDEAIPPTRVFAVPYL